MVYKVSKGGVRSGNTLRGLHSYINRRYSRQACIFGRSNLNPKEVPKFLESTMKDDFISSTLGSTDVMLSLNKKKRWCLPATVSHMIKTGNCDDGKTMVSLLERHNLKRRANCISFVCNQGRLRHVTPTQKKYFSFKLDNIDNNKSNREIRRQKVEDMKQAKLSGGGNTINNNNAGKIIDVFTVGRSEKVKNMRTCLISSKPEYRIEVVYPCPQSCSLVYNPKYSNVRMEFGDEGGMEIKSNTKSSKGKRRHRKRFTLKDLKTYEADMDAGDTSEYWDDDEDSKNDSEPVSDAESITSFQEEKDNCKNRLVFLKDKDNMNVFDDASLEIQENVMATLVAQAEKARSLCESGKPRRRRKNSSQRNNYQHALSDSNDRSHIIRTNVSDLNPLHLRKRKARKSSKKSKKNRQTLQKPNNKETNYVTLHSARVILKSLETTQELLKAKFGHCYAEANSEPRRFVINITEDVQNLLCTYRNVEQNAMYTSYLVFIFDGVYDEDVDTYKVIFNSNICRETLTISENIPFEETTFEEIMNRVASSLLDMKQEDMLDFSYSKFIERTAKPRLNFVNDIFPVYVETFRTTDEIRRVAHTEVMQESVDFSMSLSSIVKHLDYEIFCDICYENINPTQSESVSGTKLSKCSHIFCDDCWRSHFRAKLKNASVKMTCPGYGCDEIVGPVTLLSLLPSVEVSQLFQRMSEEKSESCTNSKWCPSQDCGRMIRIESFKSSSELSLDVTCACGHEFCFSCLSLPHWPATCEQAELYIETLRTLKHKKNVTDNLTSEGVSANTSLPSTEGKVEFLEVEGRICPSCSKFIEKNGGCSHMSCKCGHNFCWLCLKDYYDHTTCTPIASVVKEHTRKVRVRHLVLPTFYFLQRETKNKSKPAVSRQKAALFQKALQQRQEADDLKHGRHIKEMVKKIIHVSQKDLLVKKEILAICSPEIDTSDNIKLFNYSIGPNVTKFLRACPEIKLALHHVAEFTFVLLQDTPESGEKRRALRVANDLSGYCSFIKSILELGENQDMRTAVKRLADIQMWAKRALAVLLPSVSKLKC